MTISQFEEKLKRINPKLNIKQRGYGDIVGIFDGDRYLVRMSKGELNLNGHRTKYIMSDLSIEYGNINKRGRKTVVRMLQKLGYVKNLEEYKLLLWGV